MRNLAGVTGSVQDDTSECSASPAGVVRIIIILNLSPYHLHNLCILTPSRVEHHLHSANTYRCPEISTNT